jgi:hypothetical protein
VKSGAASSQRLSAERPIYGTQKLFARSRPTSAPRAPATFRAMTAMWFTSTPAVPFAPIPFSNGSRAEALRVSTLSGACVLYVLVRHLMG